MAENKENKTLMATIVQELNLGEGQVRAVLALIDEGNTIPFIARYRKEATGNLDEVNIRDISERYQYLKELYDRKDAVLKSIESQGKLTEELKNKIEQCETKNLLEDLYLPFKPKRRTRAMIAKEKGLEPLAVMIMEQRLGVNPTIDATAFIDTEKGVESPEEALAGARDIVAETIAETAEVRGIVRDGFMKEGVVIAKVTSDYEDKKTKFNDYYDFKERVSTIPSHRYLAIRRGEKEGILTLRIEIPEDRFLSEAETYFKLTPASPYAEHLRQSVKDAFKRLILPSVETDVRVDLKMQSDNSAVDIFAENLKNLLLASPLGERNVIGIDPGLRTGCKCAAVDATGKFLDTMTFNLVKGQQTQDKDKILLLSFIKKFSPYAIAIGNGTAGRETEAFVKEILKEAGIKDVIVVAVSEAGASVYSASEVAREEFPELDLTIRGAISIARRLQDPLAELVKVDPKAIGVGQYQHDVHQPLLQQKLSDVVESCVNFVGVDLNTASAELLSYVAGIGQSMAKKIITTRDQLGKFSSRQQLLKVPGLGARTFEQSAGFLRIHDGENPLDSSAVHPESYSVVELILKDLGLSIKEVIGKASVIQGIDPKKYLSNGIGTYTLKDVLEELNKPGRDPRSTFEPPKFRDDVMKIADLTPGMTLEGVVTNVTAFGAFVDIGVHQDGLVHISELSDSFVKDPHEVVKAGDKLKVKILEVDAERKRISLSARSGKAASMPSREPQGKKVAPVKKFESNPFASL